MDSLINITSTITISEYHLKDHLGNTSVAVNQARTVTQTNNYYPFGMRFGYSEKGSTNKYLYNGKELQEETDWLDYGARFYMADIGRWGAIDPLAESYSSQSTYNFSGNNPMRFVDLNGMNYDDYFSYAGNYLGSDDANTDYVRIMNQNVWDNNKTINENEVESIDHEIGVENSDLFSQVYYEMSIDEKLNVYDYYNPTNLMLFSEERSDRKGGMAFSTSNLFNNSQIISERLKIRLYGNMKNRYSDHSNVIINMFSHEEQHYNDYKRLGHNAFYNLTPNNRESNAVTASTEHPSYSILLNQMSDKVINAYIRSVRNYGYL